MSPLGMCVLRKNDYICARIINDSFYGTNDD